MLGKDLRSIKSSGIYGGSAPGHSVKPVKSDNHFGTGVEAIIEMFTEGSSVKLDRIKVSDCDPVGTAKVEPNLERPRVRINGNVSALIASVSLSEERCYLVRIDDGKENILIKERKMSQQVFKSS
ncbi:hypothetical protein OGAPHI_006424 [Ogataea philodendri]|uniref:Uncharacterized protein n=1 Tax=Ogataea philodendri TaxID=1378263 RepID=A0A9P8T0L7_9ASCO|nr:uncharacterized protein OGAPHI_006424 [Ogataea philodendri]KAH3661576.1 hypothetical protein OGAPHI_006424 [Ogataea philodendri]